MDSCFWQPPWFASAVSAARAGGPVLYSVAGTRGYANEHMNQLSPLQTLCRETIRMCGELSRLQERGVGKKRSFAFSNWVFFSFFQVSPVYFHFVAFIRFQFRKVQSVPRQSPTETRMFGDDRNISGEHCKNFSDTSRILYVLLCFKYVSIREGRGNTKLFLPVKMCLRKFCRECKA